MLALTHWPSSAGSHFIKGGVYDSFANNLRLCESSVVNKRLQLTDSEANRRGYLDFRTLVPPECPHSGPHLSL